MPSTKCQYKLPSAKRIVQVSKMQNMTMIMFDACFCNHKCFDYRLRWAALERGAPGGLSGGTSMGWSAPSRPALTPHGSRPVPPCSRERSRLNKSIEVPTCHARRRAVGRIDWGAAVPFPHSAKYSFCSSPQPTL